MDEHLQDFVKLEGKLGIEKEDIDALRDLVETALHHSCEKQRGYAKEILNESGNIGGFVPSKISGADGQLFMDLWHPEYGERKAYIGEAQRGNTLYVEVDLLGK